MFKSKSVQAEDSSLVITTMDKFRVSQGHKIVLDLKITLDGSQLIDDFNGTIDHAVERFRHMIKAEIQ